MNARDLESKMNYLGMERCAREILMEEKMASPEEIAIMTCPEVCEKILEKYEAVSCEDEEITLVKKEDMKIYYSLVKYLRR